MKLTTILYGIILCLAIENGKYYTLADENGGEAPPPVNSGTDDQGAEDEVDGDRSPFTGVSHAPPAPAAKLGPDGKPLQLGPDGKPLQLGPDGKPLQLGPDGKPLQLGPDGKPLQLGPDGKPLQLGPDGKPLQLGPDGKPLQLGPDGKPLQLGPDGKPLQLGPDGKPLQLGPDGKPLKLGPDGKPLKLGPDGKPLQLGPDGKPLQLGPDGKPLKLGPDGKPLKLGPDGKPLQLGPDGKPLTPATGGAGTGDSSLKGGEKDAKIVKDGCNFYDKLDLGIKPFGEIKGNKTVCSVVLNQEFDAFLYACDGTSDPPKCPSEVKTEEGVVKIETLFSQATVTDQSAKYPSKPNVFHVITGKANKEFSASCVCSKKDGTKETMELTSSFKQAGILGILGFLVVYLMK
ncbi:hypothetical protein MACK_000755 [Theileria orientalis]|uniref:6-Cys domain-containing protein n=1 Tax=Theileria orientalis TaxID=68886 RepID=A0A976QUL6_THEOR|nr:hypothetical protein MACK_000755 [Theileria orientalis]